jgi:hypothetical protein
MMTGRVSGLHHTQHPPCECAAAPVWATRMCEPAKGKPESTIGAALFMRARSACVLERLVTA